MPSRRWAWLAPWLLVACQGAAAPGSSAPGASSPDGTTEPALTWSDVRAEVPAAQAYAPTAHATPPAWLGEVDTLWLRVGDTCRSIRTSPEDKGRGALEECKEEVRKANVVCERVVEVGHTFHASNLHMCSAQLLSGEGGMGSANNSDEQQQVWSLVSASDTQLRYAITWALSVEAEKLVWVEEQCTPASVTTLTDALAAEGLADEALLDALNNRHGVFRQGRRCMEHNGVRLHAQPSEGGNYGDRGAESREKPGVHDCTIPCPDTTQELRRFNAVLSTQPFSLTSDEAAVVVHRTKAACEETAGHGLPGIVENPCQGAWLDEVLPKPRRGKRRKT